MKLLLFWFGPMQFATEFLHTSMIITELNVHDGPLEKYPAFLAPLSYNYHSKRRIYFGKKPTLLDVKTILELCY